MEIHSRRAIALGLCLQFVLSGPLAAAEIRGTVSIAPPFPVQEKMKVAKKKKDSCADEQFSQARIVSAEGGIKNVVAYLKGDFDQPWPADTAVPELDQVGCVFSPHVLIVPTGRAFKAKNSDPLAHDIRSFLDTEMTMRFEMDEFSETQAEPFKASGIYVIRCGLHPWMYAFAVSAPHPFYAVSDEDGKFTISGVPDGEYVLKLWHEALGEAEIPVRAGEGGRDVLYTFKNKA